MRVVFTRLAEIDLEEIGDYIARDNPGRALTFVQELRAQCFKIAAAPLSCAVRPELGENLRSCAHGNYVIFFVVDGSRVLIARVLHGARDLVQIFT
jgi:toxin ParE1/3/4